MTNVLARSRKMERERPGPGGWGGLWRPLSLGWALSAYNVEITKSNESYFPPDAPHQGLSDLTCLSPAGLLCMNGS